MFAQSSLFFEKGIRNGILLPKLWEKKISNDQEFEAEGWEFSNFLRSLKHFIITVKGQNNFW